MNLVEDYFSKKYFSEENFSESFEESKIDCKVLCFERVFRRHHVLNDPVNLVDPEGKDVCTAVNISAKIAIGGTILRLKAQRAIVKALDQCDPSLSSYDRAINDLQEKYDSLGPIPMFCPGMPGQNQPPQVPSA